MRFGLCGWPLLSSVAELASLRGLRGSFLVLLRSDPHALLSETPKIPPSPQEARMQRGREITTTNTTLVITIAITMIAMAIIENMRKIAAVEASPPLAVSFRNSCPLNCGSHSLTVSQSHSLTVSQSHSLVTQAQHLWAQKPEESKSVQPYHQAEEMVANQQKGRCLRLRRQGFRGVQQQPERHAKTAPAGLVRDCGGRFRLFDDPFEPPPQAHYGYGAPGWRLSHSEWMTGMAPQPQGMDTKPQPPKP